MSNKLESIKVPAESGEETPISVEVTKDETDLVEPVDGEVKEHEENDEEVVDINSWEYYSENDLLEYLKNTDPRKDEDENIMEQKSLLSYIEGAKTTDEPAEKIVEMLEKAYKFSIRQQEDKPFRDKDDWEDKRDEFNDALTGEYGKEIFDLMVVTALRHIRDKTGKLVL